MNLSALLFPSKEQNQEVKDLQSWFWVSLIQHSEFLGFWYYSVLWFMIRFSGCAVLIIIIWCLILLKSFVLRFRFCAPSVQCPVCASASWSCVSVTVHTCRISCFTLIVFVLCQSVYFCSPRCVSLRFLVSLFARRRIVCIAASLLCVIPSVSQASG